MRTSRRSRPTFWVVSFVLVLAGFGCRPGADSQPAGAPLHPVNVHLHGLIDVVWIDGGFVLVRATSGLADQVWRVAEAGGNPTRVHLPNVAGCKTTSYRSAEKLSDGRLSLVRECWKPLPADPIVDRASVAVDLSTGALEVLSRFADARTYANGDSRAPVLAGSIAWDRTFTHGYVSDGRDCGTVLALDHAGVHPLDVEIDNGESKWNLKSMAELFEPYGGCPRWGDAGMPRIAVNRDEVVFFASGGSLDRLDRHDGPFNIYRMRIGSRSPHVFATGFRFLTGMELSPDERWLAVTAQYGNDDPALWLIDMKTARIRRAAVGELSSPTWSPDGSHIAALTDAKKAFDFHLVTIDVGSVVQG